MSTTNFTLVEQGFLSKGIPPELVKELLDAFVESKRRFYLGDFRPNAVEGGRFSEAALRILQWMTSGAYTSLSDPKFKADTILTSLPNLPTGAFPESVRLHLPRAIRVVYDIRNKRNTAHLSDGIDPNVQDATFVVNTLDWILAELVRLNHSLSAGEAQQVIESIVSREVPMIQVFDDRPRILTDLNHTDHVLVLLYWHGDSALLRRTLSSWLPEKMRKNVARTLSALHEKHLVNITPTTAHITQKGFRDVESRKLIQPL